MVKLNLPEYEFNIKRTARGFSILDPLRRRFVKLTPEEWVRQNFVRYLIDDRGFPQALMANEVSLVQNGINRRCDTMVADAAGNPLVIVEYKAPDVAVAQKTFDQIVRYNMVLRARYLMVSNGMEHFCCKIDYQSNSYQFLDHVPLYSEL